ncbi:Hypothetical protein VAA_03121 [Vibrio anguillarum 775]|nr:Hypothetical protein VAA_03121 [Vibrio anguillarum 775]
MSLTTLKEVIQDIYPNIEQLYVIHYQLVEEKALEKDHA